MRKWALFPIILSAADRRSIYHTHDTHTHLAITTLGKYTYSPSRKSPHNFTHSRKRATIPPTLSSRFNPKDLVSETEHVIWSRDQTTRKKRKGPSFIINHQAKSASTNQTIYPVVANFMYSSRADLPYLIPSYGPWTSYGWNESLGTLIGWILFFFLALGFGGEMKGETCVYLVGLHRVDVTLVWMNLIDHGLGFFFSPPLPWEEIQETTVCRFVLCHGISCVRCSMSRGSPSLYI